MIVRFAVVFDAHLCVAEYLLYGPTPYDEVIRLAAELRATAERTGALRAVAFASALAGEAALLSGDLPAAERDLRESAELHRAIAAAAGEAHSLQRLAQLRLRDQIEMRVSGPRRQIAELQLRLEQIVQPNGQDLLY